MPLSRVIRPTQTDRLRPACVVPSPARAQGRQGRLGRSAALAPFALLAALAACSDPLTTLGPVPSGTPADAVGPVPGPLSRTSPVPGAMSMQAPSGTVPVDEGFEPRVTGPGGESPLMRAGTATFADPAAALRMPATEQQAPAAVVHGAHLVWQNLSAGWRSIWLMNGATWTGEYAALPQVSTEWNIAAAADFSGDGKADLIWQYSNPGWRSIWVMDGPSTIVTAVYLPTVAPEWRIAGAGDFNADGSPDIVWQNTQTGDRSIWLMNRTTYTGTSVALPNVPKEWSIVAVDDFNGDNKPDLVWQNLSIGGRSIWFMNGTSVISPAAYLPAVGSDWSIVTAADFNGDGKSDLVWQNTQVGWRSIWLMNGATWTGVYAALPQVSIDWSIAAAGDFGANGTAPTGLPSFGPPTTVSTSATQIALTWTRPSPANETSTRIERASWASAANSSPTTPIQWSEIASLGAGVTSYTDPGLSSATQYVYRARACNAAGCGPYTGGATVAQTAPSTITALTSGTTVVAPSTSQGTSRWYSIAVPAGRTSLVVTTSGGTGDADLYVSASGVNGTLLCASLHHPSNSESCTINSPAAGTYYIRVFADKAPFASVNVVAN